MKLNGEYIFRAHAGAEIDAGTVQALSPSGRFAFVECENCNVVVEIAKAEVLEDMTTPKKSVPQQSQAPTPGDTSAEQQAAQQQQ